MSQGPRTVKGRLGDYKIKGERMRVVGGSAHLFEMPGRRELLYKEFHQPLTEAGEGERLEELIEIGARLREEDGRPAVGRIAWPIDLVRERKSGIVGVVIPHAGPRFYRKEKMRVSRGLSQLRVGSMKDEGAILGAEVRLTLMCQLAEVLEVLADSDLVHGDISSYNVLWRPPPDPSIVLIDCDGLHRSSVVMGKPTPNWIDPRKKHGKIVAPDMWSDWFGLALATWRAALLRNDWPERTEERGVVLPRRLPPELTKLLRRVFDDELDPFPRPAPDEWRQVLDAIVRDPAACKRVDRAAGLPLAEPEPKSEPKPKREPDPFVRTVVRPPPDPLASIPSWPASQPPSPRRRPRRPLRWLRNALLAALLAVAVLLGKSWLEGGPPGPQDRAEAAVARWARGNLGKGAEAFCPSSSSLHANSRYACKVESQTGAVARVWVTIGEKRRMRRRIGIQRYRKRGIAADLRAHYRQRALRGAGPGLAAITCPESIPAVPGASIVCVARFGDESEQRVQVTLKTHRGRFVWSDAGGHRGRGSALR